MATAASPHVPAAPVEGAPARATLRSWLTTVDHKRIGILYLLVTLFFFATGGLMALVIRMQLETASGTVVSPDTYDQVFTMHGTTMVFLFVVPVMAAFGNYIIPLQIGARDMAFPKLNAASFWLLLFGGIVMYSSFVFGGAPTPAGPATRRSRSSRPAMASTSGSWGCTSCRCRRSWAPSTSSARSTTCARRACA